MKVLVGCEFSGRVRDAFRKRGIEAWSCDLIETTVPSPFHIIGDILDVIKREKWDMLIAFPPCTYLSLMSIWWNHKRPERWPLTHEAVKFVETIWNCEIPHISIENPIGYLSNHFRKPTQVIHPWQYGHEASKPTCLWLKNLPKLWPTKIVGKGEFYEKANGTRYAKWSHYKSGKDPTRAQDASRTFTGIAEAMADQWQPSEIQKHLASQEANLLLQNQKKTKDSQRVVLITGLTALPDPPNISKDVKSPS